MKRKVVAFVPAKGNSSRIESKNLKLLDGKPLFLHSIEKLMKCDFIDEVYLDTESDEVIDLALASGCKIMNRDPMLACNKTDGNKLFLNEVNFVEADIYIQLLGTSPFIESKTIKKAVECVLNGKHDSATLVSSQKQYEWDDNGPKYDVNSIPNSVDIPDTIIETMGLYVVSREAALKTGCRIGEKPLKIFASALEAIDVNFPDEFVLANFVASGIREDERKLYQNIKTHLSSATLSDILDDMGIQGVVLGYKPNLPKSKIFGRAKTLKIRKKYDDEPMEGIYSALKSYQTIVPGDVIVVENEVSDYAYFGELNANLAIRSGASGALIGGKTRDSIEVEKLGFPVYSSGYACADVRNRAVMESYNKNINFDGIQVSPGDLVLADQDGIVFIPSKYEVAVLKRVFEAVTTENTILHDIALGKSEDDIIRNNGNF